MSVSPARSFVGGRIVGENGAEERPLHVQGGRVVEAPPAGARAVDARGLLLFPALVNAHDHLPLNALPRPSGLGIARNCYDWIARFQPMFDDPVLREARVVPEPVRAWHGGIKNLLCGALLVAHHDPWLPVFEDPGFPVTVRRSGWCHSLGLAGRYGPGVAESYAATPKDEPWIIHLAEGVDDVAAAELSGLDALGALGSNTVLVHALGLLSRDVTRVLARGAGVVWCPTSNVFMFGRTLDPTALAAEGALALGTDSRLTGSFDLLEELRGAARLLPARAVVSLVTSVPARLLRAAGAGALAPGARADLLALSDDGGDPFEALVSSSRAGLRAVVRGGAPAVADPDLASWFDAAGVAPAAARLDGRPKLCDVALFPPEAARLEPGLELAA